MHAKGKQKKREEEKVQLLLSQVLEKKLLVRLLELATKREVVVIVVEGICKREILVGGMLVVCIGLDPCFGITKKSLVCIYEDEYSATFIIRFGIPSGTYLLGLLRCHSSFKPRSLAVASQGLLLGLLPRTSFKMYD